MSALADIVAEAFGLDFSGDRESQLRDAAAERMRALRVGDTGAYLGRLRDPARGPDELRALATRLTVAESSFFRHAAQLDALINVLVERLADVPGRVRVLSAGCAGGEEPYSIAILAVERLPQRDRERIELVAFDLDADQVRQAQVGRYSSWSLRSTPQAIRERWFARDGEGFQLDEAIRRQVRFEQRNAVAPDPSFWQPGAFDVIVCRNVLIYFTPEAFRAVIARFARALHPRGALFLGHSESLRGVTDEFVVAQDGDAFLYRRRAEDEPAAPTTSAKPRVRAPIGRHAPTPIERASKAELYDLLRAERFDAVLRRIDALDGDPEAVLLRAACLVNLDQAAEAHAALAAALRDHPADARLRLLLGLVHERSGRTDDAERSYADAVVLDPSLAMAHFYLGRLYRRRGRTSDAAAALRKALHELPNEDADRVCLVSGGFARDLVACAAAAELEACR